MCEKRKRERKAIKTLASFIAGRPTFNDDLAEAFAVMEEKRTGQEQVDAR